MTKQAILVITVLAIGTGCSRAKSVHGTWAGSYTPGNISPHDFDIIAHEEFASVTDGKLVLEMKDGGKFSLKTVGSVEGTWKIKGNTVTLTGKAADGKALPAVDLTLSKDGKTLEGVPENDGTKLTFKKQG